MILFNLWSGSSTMMLHSLSSNADQWSRDLAKLPDSAIAQLQRQNHLLAAVITREQERRLALTKFRQFKLRCIIPDFRDHFASDEGDSPGEFADAIESGLAKMIGVLSQYQNRIKYILVRHALMQFRKRFKKRAFSQCLTPRMATVAID